MASKLTRSEQRKRDHLVREAERYVAVLGDMKGVAMKIGQLLSFLEIGTMPDEHRATYQQIVGALQADAPPMPFETVAAIIESELGRTIDETFATIDTKPLAAASIGQVHAGQLPDGRAVVVKVQYPGVADAIRDDLQNTEMLASFAAVGAKLSPIRVTAEPTAIVEEVAARISEELDYRIEADNQTLFAERYANHPFLRVPRIVEELSTSRVLAMDRHDGLRWSEALEQPQELKDRWGEAIYRFVFGSLYDFGTFNADPHPGNYLFHLDGTVSFLDFGCVKTFSHDQVAAMRTISAAVFDGDDPQTLFEGFQAVGCIPRRTKLHPDRVFEWWAPIWDPGRGEEGPFTFTPEFASWVISRNFDAFGEWRDMARGMGISNESKDWTFLTRIQLGLYSVLGALRATCHWRAVHDELRGKAAPTTDLGRQHADWKQR